MEELYSRWNGKGKKVQARTAVIKGVNPKSGSRDQDNSTRVDRRRYNMNNRNCFCAQRTLANMI